MGPKSSPKYKSKFPLFNYDFEKIKNYLLSLTVDKRKEYYEYISINVEWYNNDRFEVELYNFVYPDEFNLYSYNFNKIKHQMYLYENHDKLYKYYNYVFKECKIMEAGSRDTDSSNIYNALLKQINSEFKYIMKAKFKIQVTKENEELKEPNISTNKEREKKNIRTTKLNKLQWCGTEKNLKKVFWLLNKVGFISDKNYNDRNKILVNTFENKQGVPFKENQLSIVETDKSKPDFKGRINEKKMIMTNGKSYLINSMS